MPVSLTAILSRLRERMRMNRYASFTFRPRLNERVEA